MYILDSIQCGNGILTMDIMIPNIVSLIVTLIKIGVPVLLIIFGMLDLGKAVMAQKEDEIKNAQKLFIKKLIIAVCVFLVPTFIGLALSVIEEDTSDTESCFSDIF